jgi:hypothetical protein
MTVQQVLDLLRRDAVLLEWGRKRVTRYTGTLSISTWDIALPLRIRQWGPSDQLFLDIDLGPLHLGLARYSDSIIREQARFRAARESA